ncbi:MAG: MlaD family protein [Bacteriovoracia bacterium]
MKKGMEIEMKVGLFISVGVLLIMFAVILLGGVETFLTRHSLYTVHYSDSEGVIKGAKVALNGIRVGIVENVRFDEQTNDIAIDLSINHSLTHLIRQNAVAEIATQGVLGDKYIYIKATQDGSPALPPGSTITSGTGKNLTQFLSSGEELMVSLKSIARNLDEILKGFRVNNRSDIFFDSLTKTSKNMAELTHKLNQEMDHIKIKSAIGNLDSIMAKINNGTGTLGALVNDSSLYEDVRSLFGGVSRNRIMRNLVRKTVKDNENKE